MLAKFKMSQKLIGGFLIVVFILGIAILYQITSIKSLAALEDEGAERAEADVQIGSIMARLQGSYSIFADAIINRDLNETRKDFAELRSQTEKDITAVLNLVDNAEETAAANQFGEHYRKYLSIFEKEMLPILQNMNGFEGITEIQELDGRLDQERELTMVPLMKIVKSLDNEMLESEALFDATSTRAIFVATILSVIGLAMALLIAFSLTYSITRPINDAVKNMTSSSEQVSAAAGQVSSSSQSLAEGASEQAAALEQTSASMEEMTSMTRQNADNASQADNLMREALNVITTADKSMDAMSHSMEEISEASQETSKIVKTIDEIAFQTNLLALNAAVEAARAGEAGAGFAVVADEVRNLAMRAAEAAKNTAALIEGTVAKVNTGKDIVTKTNAAFKEVAESSSKVGSLVGEISAASKEQATGFSQISEAITQMDSVTQQNSASAEESAAASEELNAQAETMMDAVIGLKALVDGIGQSAHRPPRRQEPQVSRRPATAPKFAALAAPKPSRKAAPAQPKPAAPRKPAPEEIIPMGDEDGGFEDF